MPGRNGGSERLVPEDALRVLWFFVPAYLANMMPVLLQHRLPALGIKATWS